VESKLTLTLGPIFRLRSLKLKKLLVDYFEGITHPNPIGKVNITTPRLIIMLETPLRKLKTLTTKPMSPQVK